MHLAYVRESSDFQSPARNSRGERRVNLPCLASLSVFVLTDLHLETQCGGWNWHFSMNEKTTGRRSHLVALQRTAEDRWPVQPAPVPSSCRFACLGITELSSPCTANCTCRPVGVCHVRVSWGGECGRRPLIIFNTAVPERLKTKSQLRKELWGWSKVPHAGMQDERTLDSDCIGDLSPLNLHPASVSGANTSSSLFHPPSFLPNSHSSTVYLLFLDVLTRAVHIQHHQRFACCSFSISWEYLDKHQQCILPDSVSPQIVTKLHVGMLPIK